MRWAGWGAGLFALVLLVTSCEPAKPATAFDFDGDGRADIVWIDSDGAWRRGTTDENVVIGTMAPNALFVPGDYDGDGRTEVASVEVGSTQSPYDPGPGQWITAGAAGTISFPEPAWPVGIARSYGNYMQPVPGRYDGGAKDIPAWYRQIDGTWFIQGRDPIPFGNGPTAPSTTPSATSADQDIAVPADYDGDGKTDLAVYNPRTGSYRIRSSIDDSVSDRTLLPTNGDDPLILPVPGDYDGVGHAQPAVFGLLTGWVIEGHAEVEPFGASGISSSVYGFPVPADYDGDGTTDLAMIWSDGRWQIQENWAFLPTPWTGNGIKPPVEFTTMRLYSVAPFTLVGRCVSTLALC